MAIPETAPRRLGAVLNRERRALLVFGLSALVFALGSHRVVFSSGNDSSRWAHMEAIVDHHSSSIERSRFAATVDHDILDGRAYSNKPPLFAIVGAGLYFLLQQFFGWSFATGIGMPEIVRWLTVGLVGLPTAALLALFDRELRLESVVSAERAALVTLALGAGTLVTSFAVTLNNHNLAAALIFSALVMARRRHGFRCGALVGLAAAIDILPGAGLVPVFGALLWGGPDRRPSRRFGAGLLFAIVVFVAANVVTSGTILPPRFAAGVHHAASAIGPQVGGVLLPQRWTYIFETLVGGHGFYSVSPVLLFGAVGLVSAVRGGTTAARESRWLAVGILGQILGHGLLAGSYGGWSYGFRYLIPVMPLVMLYAPRALSIDRIYKAFLLALPISLATAALGAYHPWPPAYEQKTLQVPIAHLVTNPVGGNATCWAEQHWPDSLAARTLGAHFVSTDVAEQHSYCRLFFLSKSDFRTARRYGPTSWRP